MRGVAFVYFVGIMATFFIMAFLIWVTKEYTQPRAISANRANERAENLQTLLPPQMGHEMILMISTWS